MATKQRGGAAADPHQLGELLRTGPDFTLDGVDPASTPGFPGGRRAGEKELKRGLPAFEDLQERLFAASRGGDDPRRVLLVLQGMDTAGKGGIMRHVVGAADPQGIRYHAFKAPTPEERAHDFLWRVRRELPEAGEIGVFDRSHYEDVLIVRVHGLVPPEVVDSRYGEINAFEAEQVAAGTTMVKVMLHISPRQQLKRLAKRLERPEKHWKYNVQDLAEHAFWPQYQQAYQLALTRCSTPQAPWYVVPADHKWYARWAVQHLLLNALQGINPQWPAANFDVAAEKARVREAMDAECRGATV